MNKNIKLIKIISVLIILLITLLVFNFFYKPINNYKKETIETEIILPQLLSISQNPNCVSNFILVEKLLDWVKNYYIQSCTWLKWETMDSQIILQWSKNSIYIEPTWNWINYDYPKWRIETDYPAFKYCTDKWIWWRLPTKKEIFSIMTNVEKNSHNVFTKLESIYTNHYWSSTVYSNDIQNARFGKFWAGYFIFNKKLSKFHVICIHD